MVRVGVTVAVVLVAAGIANAQPSTPAPEPTPSSPPTLEPIPPAPPPQQQQPEAKPSLYEQCREQRRRISAEADATSNLKERARLLQSMPECRPDMDDAPAASPAVTSSSEEQDDGSGFAVEVHLETGQIFIDSNTVLPTTQAGLFLGFRGRSVTFGVAIDIGRISESMTDPTGTTTTASSNMLLIMPGLRAVLARSHDDRTELLGEADIGYGRNWTSDDNPMTASTPSTGHLRIQAAPGLRYWVSQSFAVGAVAGLRYERFSRSSSSGGGTTSDTLAMTALFSAVQLTGVF